MPLAGRAYFAFAAIVLTTMATRIGWIDWNLIFTAATTLVVGVLVNMMLAALLIGLPTVALISFVNWLAKPAPARPIVGGHRDVR
ncbi:MAG: hypothetical protein ACRYF2_23270 [Janthinobacterium lividum]